MLHVIKNSRRRSLLAVLSICIVVAGVLAAVARAEPPPATAPGYELGRVDVVGRGPVAAILIPGYTCDGSVYSDFTAAAGDDFTFYVVTLPGFGGTPPPAMPAADAPADASPWIDDAAEAIFRLARDRKLDRPLLVGHSMGGTLVYKLLAEHPETFRGGVSVDGLPGYPVWGDRKASAAMMGKTIASQTPDAFRAGQRRSLTNLVTGEPNQQRAVAMAEKVDQPVAAEYMRQFLLCDFSDKLPAIRSPFLMLAAISPDYPPALATQFGKFFDDAAAKAPGSKVVRFMGTRHFIMFDRPAEFARVIRDFAAGRDVPAEIAAPTTQPTIGASSQ